MTPVDLESKQHDLYTTIQSLSPSSPDAEFENFGNFFALDSKAYLKNMLRHDQPAKGREEIMQKLKDIMTENQWQILERRVLTSCVTSDGLRVFCETKQTLLVCGIITDPFFETKVVVFDNHGLIQELRLYSCRSQIVFVVQQVTGKGPYALADFKAEK